VPRARCVEGEVARRSRAGGPEAQAAGGRVVFTNGCFDLLHRGHTRYLERARSLGDALVVAINSDRSVRALKARAPRGAREQRAEVMAALAAVDYVVVFDELDPARVIRAVRPDVLVKGGDWPISRIVGADYVQSRGGRVLSLPYVEGAYVGSDRPRPGEGPEAPLSIGWCPTLRRAGDPPLSKNAVNSLPSRSARRTAGWLRS